MIITGYNYFIMQLYSLKLRRAESFRGCFCQTVLRKGYGWVCQELSSSVQGSNRNMALWKGVFSPPSLSLSCPAEESLFPGEAASAALCGEVSPCSSPYSQPDLHHSLLFLSSASPKDTWTTIHFFSAHSWLCRTLQTCSEACNTWVRGKWNSVCLSVHTAHFWASVQFSFFSPDVEKLFSLLWFPGNLRALLLRPEAREKQLQTGIKIIAALFVVQETLWSNEPLHFPPLLLTKYTTKTAGWTETVVQSPSSQPVCVWMIQSYIQSMTHSSIQHTWTSPGYITSLFLAQTPKLHTHTHPESRNSLCSPVHCYCHLLENEEHKVCFHVLLLSLHRKKTSR